MRVDWDEIRFLYRGDAGLVDRATWRRAAGLLLAIFAPLTLIWFALLPFTDHDLSNSPLFVPMTALAYAYLILYAFATLLIGASFVNLSAKRFRALSLTPPLGLAALAPLLAFLAGAAHWLQPRVAEAMPRWEVHVFDAAFLIAAAWTLWRLGLRD